jgi:hypothetical protein
MVGGASIASMLFTPGGDGAISIYRIDAASGQNPRSATIDDVAGDVITLTAAVADQFFAQVMAGVSYIRVWNTSKDPDQSAWVKAAPAANQLQVVSAADIAGWVNGETVQVGDPETVTPGRVMALDISQMLQTVLGGVFRQSGIMVRASLLGGTAGDRLAITPTGVGGSNVNCAVTQTTGSQAGDGVTVIPCTELSPVSNSNLVLVTETLAGAAGTRLISSIAVFA